MSEIIENVDNPGPWYILEDVLRRTHCAWRQHESCEGGKLVLAVEGYNPWTGGDPDDACWPR